MNLLQGDLNGCFLPEAASAYELLRPSDRYIILAGWFKPLGIHHQSWWVSEKLIIASLLFYH